MPKDNIERLLKRGAAKDAMALSEITYEAHGPGGVALIIETKTDNKNRTVAQIRHVLKEGGGMLVHFLSIDRIRHFGDLWKCPMVFQDHGPHRCIYCQYKRNDYAAQILKSDKVDGDQLMEVALEAGADDIEDLDDCYRVFAFIYDFISAQISCEPSNLKDVANFVNQKGFEGEIEIAEVPTVSTLNFHSILQNTQALTPEQEEKLEKLLNNLEDLEDVDEVYHNAE